MTREDVIRMPKLADTLVEGTLGRWLKQVGDHVAAGEALASIETDKVTTDIMAPTAGTLLEILVGEGQTVAIDTPIARVGAGASTTTAEAAPHDNTRGAPPRPTPVAARLLADHGVSATQIPKTRGRLKKEDVLNFVQAQQRSPLTSMRRAIADHMTRAYQSIPHGQTVMDADLTALVAWRDARKQDGVNVTFTALFVYALGRQLARLADGPVDIGVAVALDNGLVVPVLRDVDRLSLEDVAGGIADLAQRARARQLAPDELQGGRMTLTNVGSFGNLTASPIIPLGQLGILAPGIVEERPLPTPERGIRLGWRCRFALVYDRRSLDDFGADRFLRGVIDGLAGVHGRTVDSPT